MNKTKDKIIIGLLILNFVAVGLLAFYVWNLDRNMNQGIKEALRSSLDNKIEIENLKRGAEKDQPLDISPSL